MPVIRTRELCKVFHPGLRRAPVEALRGITMAVEEREIFGFLGPNGAGKTTTMKILLGLIFPTSGEASIFDRPVGDRESKRLLGFAPEQPYFYDHLTALELMDHFGRLFGIDAPTRGKRAGELLERVGLGRAREQPLRGFSKGMLQRFGIAQALINDPQLVILDEPMSGLDPVGRKEVRDLILQLRAEKRTVFFSTHILSDVEVVCDRVAILNQGKVVALSPLKDLVSQALDAYEMILSGPIERARSEIGKRIPDTGFVQTGDRLLVKIPAGALGDATGLANAAGCYIHSLEPVRKGLEEVFLKMISA